jgi:hypothetical protein
MNRFLFTMAIVAMALTGCFKKESSSSGATLPAAATSAKKTSTAPPAVGWVEYVRLTPGSALLKAKLDAGALTSSLDVRDLQVFRKQDRDWVRFTYLSGGRSVTVERPLARICRIKKHGGGFQERPAVRLTIQLGDFRQDTEVNLVNRQNFLYPLLLGRQFLNDAQVVVDTSRTFTCKSRDYAIPVAPLL